MISALRNIPELRSRILFTLFAIIIVRLGVALPLPGVDISVIKSWIDWQVQGEGSTNAAAAFGALLNVFSGGGLQQCGIFALGLMPYISSSIIMQLLTAVVPQLSKLAREDGGHQKITQYTRFLTIMIALIQSLVLARSLENPENIFYLSGISQFGDVVLNFGPLFFLTTIVSIVVGTMFLMWLGDQITEKGIGNGISLIIAVNIISALPGALIQAWKKYATDINPTHSLILVFLVFFLLFVIAAVISITEAHRRIVIQYAKRMVGRKQYMGQNQYLPLKVNYAGVMPIIFASAILSLPPFIINMLFKSSPSITRISFYLQEIFSPASAWYYLIAGLMIFFFSYFWVATMFQANEIADNLKKNGGYIPGIRPGDATAKFLDMTMSRLTFSGSIFLVMIFILPIVLSSIFHLPVLVTQFFGGTSLLILVGVLLEIIRHFETHLLQHNYSGFFTKAKSRNKYHQSSQSLYLGKIPFYLLVLVAIFIIVWVTSLFYKG